MNRRLVEKMDKILQLNKPKKLLTMWSIDNICNKLKAELISNRLDITRHSELLATLYQNVALKIFDNLEETSINLMKKSYELWKTIYYSKELRTNDERIDILFKLTTTGIIAGYFAETRMILKELDFDKMYESEKLNNGTSNIKNSIFIVFFLLIRKLNGWYDINKVDTIINELNNKLEHVINTTKKEIIVLGVYLNVLEVFQIYKNYIIKGKPDNIENVITRNIIIGQEILEECNYGKGVIDIMLIKYSLKKSIENSIWSSVGGISEKIDEYVKFLTLESNKYPIFDLWPSQKKAIATNLFDINKSAVIVQMPTSAGKTLLAKFYILQVLSLYSKAKIAYIVPTRALVNQVKRDLKKEFSRFDLKVEVAIPFMELDELEQEVLIKDSDIIVTTPEKLDLMVRTKNTFIDDLKLVIVDEAHTIQDPHRGAKLELLLAMLRKENRNLKFLMLSPFIENAKSIVKWLSNDRGLDILVDWKPSQQFTGISEIVEGKRGRHKEVVKYIPSSLNDMYYNEFSIKIGNITNKNISKIDRAVTLAQKYERIGGVLILCIRREYSESIMSLLLERNDISCEKLKQLTKLLDLIEEEMGKDSLLYKSVKKGCAYHHSAIPLVIREEIEEAISKQLITIVAATTTLAQGMNFPIATVIFQGMTMPENKSSRRMTVSEFWNIAGRAGRALVDKEGHIIAICKETKDVKSFKEYLSNKNQEVFSSLLKVIRSIPEECLKLTYLEQHNELSSFLQYIYHIVRLNSDIEVEDLLRGSLVYSNLQELGEMEQGEKLLRITNEYIKMISNDMKKKNLMSIIDKSGLSSISMHSLITKIRKEKNIDISINSIFNKENSTLERIISIANSIPEINLGIYDSKNEFNPQLISNITKAWVGGYSIRFISEKYISDERAKTIDEKMRICGKYIYSRLINNLPWAISAIMKANGIVNSIEEDKKDDIMIPSYIYFGVNNKEAVILCMFGVTRYAAFILAKEWRSLYGEVRLQDINKVEDWLGHLSLQDWKEIFYRYNGKKVETNYYIWRKQK